MNRGMGGDWGLKRDVSDDSRSLGGRKKERRWCEGRRLRWTTWGSSVSLWGHWASKLSLVKSRIFTNEGFDNKEGSGHGCRHSGQPYSWWESSEEVKRVRTSHGEEKCESNGDKGRQSEQGVYKENMPQITKSWIPTKWYPSEDFPCSKPMMPVMD